VERTRYYRNKVYLGLHLVWTTRGRNAFITAERERAIYGCIVGQARQLGCTILAINGMPDHVHLLVLMPTTLSTATLAQQVKGVSSAWIRDHIAGDTPFGWAEGYGAFSVSRSHLTRVTQYIRGQKQHHADAELWPEVEEPREEVEAEPG
jgi:REP element-mobilizing transposase RayT